MRFSNEVYETIVKFTKWLKIMKADRMNGVGFRHQVSGSASTIRCQCVAQHRGVEYRHLELDSCPDWTAPERPGWVPVTARL